MLILVAYTVAVSIVISNTISYNPIFAKMLYMAIAIGGHLFWILNISIRHSLENNKLMRKHYLLVALIIGIVGFSVCHMPTKYFEI